MKGSKRKWTPTEDAALVACMVELKTNRRFNTDTGFKAGYLLELEKMMSGKLGVELKANPHIASHIKTLRKEWAVVYDMIHGSTSGFGWDSNKNMPVVEHDVWENYIKSHKNAAPFRRRSFPHYEELSLIYEKDRAARKDA